MSVYLPKIDRYLLFEEDELADLSISGAASEAQSKQDGNDSGIDSPDPGLSKGTKQPPGSHGKTSSRPANQRAEHTGFKTQPSLSRKSGQNSDASSTLPPLQQHDSSEEKSSRGKESDVVPLPDIRVTNGQVQTESSEELLLTRRTLTTVTEDAELEDAEDGPETSRKDTPASTEDTEDDPGMPRYSKRLAKGRKQTRRSSLGRLFRYTRRYSTGGELQTREQIRRKFSQAIKAVLSIRKLAAIMIKKSEEPSAMIKSYTGQMDSKTFSENLKSQGLSFDPSYFKANREISVSNEVKTILSLPPSSRTQEQIQTAMYGLQSLPSFAEYPLHMQEKLAKVAWYEVVPPKRTIIRQGHYAENFYFILSGQAVVTILIRDPKTNESQVRTANFMRKGTSFGELALLHHSRRTATVTSQDTVQLLSIGREDFFDIFMSRQGQDTVPEHIKFISQLEFMRHWPLERLLEHPEHCLLHFFKRNMVIVKDSRQSEWLYIVKSGSCQVLKQLRGVTPRLGLRKQENLDESFHIPQTGTAIRGPKVDTGLYRPTPRYSTKEDEYFHLWRKSGKEGKGQLSQKNGVNGTGKKKQGGQFSKESYTDRPETGGPHFAQGKASQSRGAKVPRLRLKGNETERPSSSSGSKLKTNGAEGVATKPANSQNPVFVQVSSLKPRDMFGLEQLRFANVNLDSVDISVSLVSRGAECIMLSKEFYRRHATELVKKNLQQLIRPYPDEDTLQDSLQTKVDWDLFKHTLIEDITSPPVV